MSATAPTDDSISLPARLPDGGPIQLHYLDWGGSGRPLVLLHGLASSCRIWDFTAPLLAERFRVFAVDQRGHGLSDRPGSYSFNDVTGDLAGFIEAFGLERPVIAGHSWGGSVAVQFAADHADTPSAIALIDGGFTERWSSDMDWEKAQVMMRPPEIDGVPVETFLGFVKKWPDIGALWSDQLGEMILSTLEVRDGSVYRRLPIPDHMLIARAIWEQKASELWERVRCPVLLVPAMKESKDPRAESWMKAKSQGIETAKRVLKDVTVVPMHDTIHDVPIQRPRELAQAIIDFAAAA
jgi:pimeloyl-ACP methyl ester carboxylesterase